MTWAIEVTETAARQIKKLGPDAEKRLYQYLGNRIAPLHDPRQLGKQLRSSQFPNLWRYRIGNYRILCEIDDHQLRVLVVKAGHRRTVYRRP